MTEIAIQSTHLSKLYTIGGRKSLSLRDSFSAFFNNSKNRNQDSNEFWALKDLSFKIKAGEVYGIIGKNGAGKSTLLKVLSKITKPTNGNVEIYGRVGSLLEVGTGFHPELTGKENIMLNGTILGMSRMEIRNKFDEIIDFSGIEKFIDTPVKHYSSGMYVRLAFAVAANLEPEILLIDEVLAVGDADFQKKCMGKMSDVARSGRTILFVSHHLNSLKNLCTNGIVLKNGQNDFEGDIKSAIEHYLKNHVNSSIISYVNPEPRKAYDAYIIEAKLLDKHLNVIHSPVEVWDRIIIFFSFVVQIHVKNLHLVFFVENEEGEVIYFNDRTDQSGAYMDAAKGTYECMVDIPNPLLIKGTYYIKIGLINNDEDTYNFYERILSFELVDTTSFRTFKRHGYIFKPTDWAIKKSIL